MHRAFQKHRGRGALWQLRRRHLDAFDLRQPADHFARQAGAQPLEAALRRQIDERLHRHRAALQRGRRRRAATELHVAAAEDRRVPAFRQVDHDLIVLSLFLVIPLEPRAQPPGLNTHDRVCARIE